MGEGFKQKARKGTLFWVGVLFFTHFRVAVPRKGGENMAEPGALDYFYGTEAEQYTF